jgi:endo-1,4-beta-xylanase
MAVHKSWLCLIVVLAIMSCKKRTTSICSNDIALFSFSNFPIGAAVDDLLLQNDSNYQKVFTKQFNSATAENIFKPAYLHPEENLYNWADADELITFCRNNNMRVHGHTLIWHQQNPAWMNEFQGSKAEWEAMMKLHIVSIVRYYSHRIFSWDVVNEAFNEDGSLRDNIWLQHIGPSYIEKAFKYAHEANPEAKLFYNDYGLETNPTKLNAVIRFFNTLKLKGVTIDGIGLQMHINIKYSQSNMIEQVIQAVANQNYLVHLSEVDISLNPLSKEYQLNDKDLEAQAQLMAKIVRTYKNIPKHLQFGITFWGISDNYSWIRSYFNRVDYPLLFDENFKPKPIYCNLIDAL